MEDFAAGFAPPQLYRELSGLGWFDPANIDRADLLGSRYLYLPDVEWWSPGEIAAYRPLEHYGAGFVPFASTGAGDFWSWRPERAAGGAAPIALCPHDYAMAAIDAPDFRGWLYRRVLAAANGQDDLGGEAGTRAWIGGWRRRLAPWFPAAWSATLAEIEAAPWAGWQGASGLDRYEGLLPPAAYAAIVARDLACPGLDEPFRWMK